MYKSARVFLISMALGLPVTAQAEYPRFNLDAQYVEYSGDRDSEGFRVNGQLDFTRSLYMTGSHRRLNRRESDYELYNSSLGLGYRLWLGEATSLRAEVSGEHWDERPEGEFIEDRWGYGARGGLGHRLADELEVDASARVISLETTDNKERENIVGYNARARYYAGPNMSFTMEYDVEDGDSAFIVGGTLSGSR